MLAELKQRAHGPAPDCWAAIRELGANESHGSLEILLGLLKSTEEYHRRAAVSAISHHISGGSAVEQIRACLRDESEYVVRAACEALGVLEDDPSHPEIVRHLGSTIAETRIAALRALMTLWREQAFEQVFTVHRTDSDEDVRRQAGWTLSASKDPANWAKLIELWSRSELPRYRVWACELAGSDGRSELLARIEPLRHDPDGHVRKAALAALGR